MSQDNKNNLLWHTLSKSQGPNKIWSCSSLIHSLTQPRQLSWALLQVVTQESSLLTSCKATIFTHDIQSHDRRRRVDMKGALWPSLQITPLLPVLFPLARSWGNGWPNPRGCWEVHLLVVCRHRTLDCGHPSLPVSATACLRLPGITCDLIWIFESHNIFS